MISLCNTDIIESHYDDRCMFYTFFVNIELVSNENVCYLETGIPGVSELGTCIMTAICLMGQLIFKKQSN
jgi:hypothetical protein